MRGSRSPAAARTRGAAPGPACALAPSTERLVSLPYLSHRQLMRRVDIETCGPGQY
ncbi:MAG: hypothetical protein QOI64_2537, partial [Solirubrobacteraceae bacterium]|nr:hypothetical protein [Solirubrobacteraceae bacterium]